MNHNDHERNGNCGATIPRIIEGTNMTVLEMIEEDALGYRVSDPDIYAEALSFYEKTKSSDGHPEVIEILRRIGAQDVSGLQAQRLDELRADLLADL